MSFIRISGWRPGFQKVSHTQLLQRALQMSLAEAKATTDRVLSCEPVELRLPSREDGSRLVQQLRELGALAEVSDV